MAFGDKAIRLGLNHEIVIVPYKEERLNNASYDVELGDWIAEPIHEEMVIDPTKVDSKEYFRLVNMQFNGGMYELKPWRRVLAHTQEFIGGRMIEQPKSEGFVTIDMERGILGVMKTKSTAARWGLDVCMAAGWGDVGYYNRWTLEITNTSPWTLLLKPRMLLAQVVFEVINGVETSYEKSGSYQKTADIEAIMRDWKPEDMLPKKLKVA